MKGITDGLDKEALDRWYRVIRAKPSHSIPTELGTVVVAVAWGGGKPKGTIIQVQVAGAGWLFEVWVEPEYSLSVNWGRFACL